MNVYSYLDLELNDRGWFRESQSVFYTHITGSNYKLEPLSDGSINVLQIIPCGIDKEVELLPAGEFDRLEFYSRSST